jgi:hypothetical protein
LGKSNIEFAKEIFDWISQIRECNVLTIDLSSFFDTLDHGILKEQWQRVNGVPCLSKDHYIVFKSLTNCGALPIKASISSSNGGIAIHMNNATKSNTEPTTAVTA